MAHRKPARKKSRTAPKYKARRVVRRKAPVRDPAVLDITFQGNGERGRKVHFAKSEGGDWTDSNTID